ncbi:hypothetical protein [Aeromonas veronii]|uniref:hypothetical protein n=1 Tax=Aeromonas veronii TaxID=654 RepID=UPI001115BB70|nr:hypothetical protein [Aeromonas veronii]MBS4704507.1 hypothetical protein [Aeromonas veronii]TNI98913.1 hypothetical protein CF114_09615 [Aeromonas veronii]
MALLPLAGCDLLAEKYRVEFRDGSWREIAITPFSSEARWSEGCATGEVLSDMKVPIKRGGTVNGREQLLIGGEKFELDDNNLYRSNGMVFGHSPDHIQRGLKGMDICRTLRPERGGLPKLKARGFGD